MAKTVKVVYDAGTLKTKITVDGKEFDTSRINGKEIEDWAYPFMMRKVKWNGFYDEMVEALGGDKEFNLVFEGSEDALAELKESWEEAPVTIVSGENNGNIVIIDYDEDNLKTSITINGKSFDTSRINGKEIDDWIYPFMMRKVKWDGIFEELAKVIGSDEYTVQFVGSDENFKKLSEDKPSSVSVELRETISVNDNKNDESYEMEDTAFELYNDGKYEEAFEIRKKAAEMGNVVSISNLGEHYRLGNGVEQDYKKALEYYKKAADMGNAWSLNKVGFMYNNGYGCEMNESKAFEYFMKAAEQNEPEAQYWVGMCYKNSWGVDEDLSRSAEWFEKSSNNKYLPGMREFGLCLYNGFGGTVGKDCDIDTLKDLAELLWMDAAEEGDIPSLNYLGEYELETGHYDDAFKNLKAAYESGYKEAASNLALCYECGYGTDKNYKKAVQILEENVAENPVYYVQLGKIFHPMMAEYHNYAVAAQYFQKAVDNEFVEGYYLLGLYYANGWGVVKNKERAKELLKVAMENGHEDAAEEYNSIIKTEGYIDTAKKIGKGALSVLGTLASAYIGSAGNSSYYDDDDEY